MVEEIHIVSAMCCKSFDFQERSPLTLTLAFCNWNCNLHPPCIPISAQAFYILHLIFYILHSIFYILQLELQPPTLHSFLMMMIFQLELQLGKCDNSKYSRIYAKISHICSYIYADMRICALMRMGKKWRMAIPNCNLSTLYYFLCSGLLTPCKPFILYFLFVFVFEFVFCILKLQPVHFAFPPLSRPSYTLQAIHFVVVSWLEVFITSLKEAI